MEKTTKEVLRVQVADYKNDNGERFLAIWPEGIKDYERGAPICLITPKETETEKDYANAELICTR